MSDGTSPGTPLVLRASSRSAGRNRWGDYSAVVIDPTDQRKFWTFQEFVSATDTWAIQITEINTSSECFLLLGLARNAVRISPDPRDLMLVDQLAGMWGVLMTAIPVFQVPNNPVLTAYPIYLRLGRRSRSS